MAWGGLRGAVSLALALEVHALQKTKPGAFPEEFANKVLFYTAVVVILTLVVNAPTTGPLLRWLDQKKRYRLDDVQVSLSLAPGFRRRL